MDNDKIKVLDSKLKQLIERFPNSFDHSLLKERDRLLAFFDNDFIQKRSINHLLRLLSTQYLKKKKLLSTVSLAPKTRCIKVRVMPTKLEFPFVTKWVVGILVQISLRSRYELFDHEQLLKAVQKLIPSLRIVKGSVYTFQGPDDSIKTIYAEFEKNQNEFINIHELKALKTSLEEELLLRIERLVPAVFMTRNQEEVLRNILTLSQEIETPEDLPEVMVSFETQTPEEFVFTVICVRPENFNSIPVDNLLKQRNSFLQWILEKKQLVKYLDQHQPIFAYIFRVLLTPNPDVLRSDGSLNFFAARQKIGSLLAESLGEFRDFNGGILIKQEEMLHTLKNALPEVSPELIENVFYSIAPIEMQAILPIHVLKALFQLFQHISELPLNDASHYLAKSRKKDQVFIVMIRIPNGTFYDLSKDHLNSFDLPEIKLASLNMILKDSYLIAYLLESDDSRLQNRFLDSLQKLLAYWSDEVKKRQVLRLTLENPLTSLDPRIGGEAVSALLLKMLFEGLMRIGPEGDLENCLAEQIEISTDRKTYLFKLRSTVWSDGTPLTSFDFEYAWKKILSPRFSTPFAYLFYLIKNAELAKKGVVGMNQVGIQALSDHTLKVELETPSLNFLEFLAHPIFSPICRHIDINQPNWPTEEGSRYICNGAFTLQKNNKDSSYVLIKNPRYWDRDKILLDSVLVTTCQPYQTYEMFSQNKIHLMGVAWTTWDNHYQFGENDDTISYPDHGVYWCVCNTKHPLLKNNKIRRALSLAIDRLHLLNIIQYPKKPAYSPLPSSHSQLTELFVSQLENEKELFREGLTESGFSLSEIPPLTISFTQKAVFGKPTAEFLSTQWKQTFGINASFQGYDYKTLFSKLTSGEFQLALIRWQPWVNDPFYTLNFFANPDEQINWSRWSHPHIQALLQKAQVETDYNQRNLLLRKIEEILVQEMPIIPLFETHLQMAKKKYLILKPNHTLMDLKWARLV